MKKFKIWYQYLSRGIKTFKFVIKKKIGHEYGGIILYIQTYMIEESSKFFIPIIKFKVSNDIYWKPYKDYISEEALPNVTERNGNGTSEFVNIWFKVNEFNDIYNIKIIEKIKLDNALTDYLNYVQKK